MACKLKTMKLLDCVLIGVCAVIGSNMVSLDGLNKHNQVIHSSDYSQSYFISVNFFFPLIIYTKLPTFNSMGI